MPQKPKRHHVSPSTELPPLDDERKIILVLETILDVKQKKLRNRMITKYLVQWKDLTTKEPLRRVVMSPIWS